MKLAEEKSKSVTASWIHGMMFMLGALSVVLFNQVFSSLSSFQGGPNGFKPYIFKYSVSLCIAHLFIHLPEI